MVTEFVTVLCFPLLIFLIFFPPHLIIFFEIKKNTHESLDSFLVYIHTIRGLNTVKRKPTLTCGLLQVKSDEKSEMKIMFSVAIF